MTVILNFWVKGRVTTAFEKPRKAYKNKTHIYTSTGPETWLLKDIRLLMPNLLRNKPGSQELLKWL